MPKRCTPEGYYRRYGAPGTPTDQGFYRVYDPFTGADDDDILVPIVNMPQVFHAMQPGEASPTGKSGVGFVMHAVEHQPVEDTQRNFIIVDPQPIYYGQADLIMYGAVNPYDTLTGEETYGSGYDSPGVQWTA
jgi:hypothetical protein